MMTLLFGIKDVIWQPFCFQNKDTITVKQVSQAVNQTGYINFAQMVSQYLLIHSKALQAVIKEIEGKNTKSAIS